MTALPAPVGSSDAAAACRVAGVVKHYGGVRALAGVDLEVRAGEVHAIVGENGAGKSTLMKILAGAEQPDAGEVLIGGRPVVMRNVSEANEHGVAIVFQELSLFPQLDVLANLFLLRAPRRLGLVERRAMRARARPALESVGLDVDVDRPVVELSLHERQLLEIARALLADSSILILDEPNSALNARESERLFEVMRQLRDEGVTLIYVSHRLEEVLAIADRITVIRNGSVVRTSDRSATTIPQVIADMIGRRPADAFPRRAASSSGGDPLTLEGVSVKGRLHGVTLAARPGEILGLAGLEGSGASVVLDVLFGACRPDAGTVTLPSGRPGPRDIPSAVAAGIARVPGDRRGDGVMLEQSVLVNMSQVTAGTLGRYGFYLRDRQLRRRAEARAQALRLVTPSLDAPVGELSGGNQQKVVIGKWLEADPWIVLLDDPTRGVDVGAKGEIHQLVQSLADEGRIVLFSSSELPDYVRLCDRVVVFYQGRVCGDLVGDAITEHRLLAGINTGVL